MAVKLYHNTPSKEALLDAVRNAILALEPHEQNSQHTTTNLLGKAIGKLYPEGVLGQSPVPKEPPLEPWAPWVKWFRSVRGVGLAEAADAWENRTGKKCRL